MAAAPHSPGCNEERVHDAQEWELEAHAIIKVGFTVNLPFYKFLTEYWFAAMLLFFFTQIMSDNT